MSAVLDRVRQGRTGDPPVLDPPGDDDLDGNGGGGVRLTFFATPRTVEAICEGTDFQPDDLYADETLTPNHHFDPRANRALELYWELVDQMARGGQVFVDDGKGRLRRVVFE